MMAETPKRYTSRLRLKRAALRLLLLDDGVLDIALDCGFSCHETFSRAFRRRFGVAPQAFRKNGRLPLFFPPRRRRRPSRISRRMRNDRSLVCLGVPCLEFYRVNRVVADLAIVNTEIAIPVRRRRRRA
jgi:hypothetical protein